VASAIAILPNEVGAIAEAPASETATPGLGYAAGLGGRQRRGRLLEDGLRFLLQRATLTASARLEALERSLAKLTDEEVGHDLIMLSE
jgi:hypothetical protein